MSIAQTLIEHLSEAILSITDEATRLQVCESLINLTLEGYLCDDKRQLTAIPDATKPDVLRLVNMADLPRIMELRKSIH